MRRPLRVLGHPLHPVLVHMPLGILGTSIIWDIVALATDDLLWRQIARWSIGLGLVLALPTAVVGLIDFRAIPRGDAAKGTAWRHMLFVVGAVVLFAASLIFRFDLSRTPEGNWGPGVLCSVVGLVLLIAGAYQGGELVYRHGRGLEELAEHAGDVEPIPDRHRPEPLHAD